MCLASDQTASKPFFRLGPQAQRHRQLVVPKCSARNEKKTLSDAPWQDYHSYKIDLLCYLAVKFTHKKPQSRGDEREMRQMLSSFLLYFLCVGTS